MEKKKRKARLLARMKKKRRLAAAGGAEGVELIPMAAPTPRRPLPHTRRCGWILLVVGAGSVIGVAALGLILANKLSADRPPDAPENGTHESSSP